MKPLWAVPIYKPPALAGGSLTFIWNTWFIIFRRNRKILLSTLLLWRTQNVFSIFRTSVNFLYCSRSVSRMTHWAWKTIPANRKFSIPATPGRLLLTGDHSGIHWSGICFCILRWSDWKSFLPPEWTDLIEWFAALSWNWSRRFSRNRSNCRMILTGKPR